tara:strand:+ start:100 stop:843 length:744 start_codon:yes stop_codon:yes gene_type:complete
MVSCAFTDATSTRGGRVVSDCRRSGRLAVYVQCGYCTPGQLVTRCSVCYRKMQRAVEERCAVLEKQTGCKRVEEPALRALRVIDWLTLASSGDCGAEGAAYLEALADERWRWRIPCPCCYTFCVGPVQPQVPLACCTSAPRVTEELIDFDARRLSRPSGLIGPPRPVRLHVVLADPMTTYSESAGVRSRGADPPAHENYGLYWAPPPPHPDGCAAHCESACRVPRAALPRSHGAGAPCSVTGVRPGG